MNVQEIDRYIYQCGRVYLLINAPTLTYGYMQWVVAEKNKQTNNGLESIKTVKKLPGKGAEFAS